MQVALGTLLANCIVLLVMPQEVLQINLEKHILLKWICPN